MTGIDLKLRFKERPTETQLKELQYDLMHRFGRNMFRLKEDGGKKVPVVNIAESSPDETWVEVLVRGAYYHIGLEYGHGLLITVLLLYLARRYPEAEVWYRPDQKENLGIEELRFDEQKSLELLYYFLDCGSLPFLGALTGLENAMEGVESPLCSFCGVPMMRGDSEAGTAQFYCAGCGEMMYFEGEEYETWVRKGTGFELPSDDISDGETPF